MVGTIGLAGREPGKKRPGKEEIVLAGAMAASGILALASVGAVAARAPLHGAIVGLTWAVTAMLILELAAGRAYLLPTWKRQVRAGSFLRYSRPTVALLWGAEQGFFVFTVMNTWGYWVLVALVASSRSPALGVLGGLVAGFARGSQVLWTTVIAGAGSPQPTIATETVTRARPIRLGLAVVTLLALVGSTIP